jgi:hypothetical protein
MQSSTRFTHVSDDELLRRLAALLGDSRRVEADLVAHIGEVDERRLFAREASPSMFRYCTDVLHLSEAEAGLRITVARAAREHPAILAMLGGGRLHLSGIALLAPHLTPENAAAVLERAAHRSKREIEELVAELDPQLDVPAVIRKVPVAALAAPPIETATSAVPAPSVAAATSPAAFALAMQHRPDGIASTATSPAVIKPLAPARYKVQFTASLELREKLERLQKLMSADLAAVIERAVSEKLERLETKRFGLTKAPRKAAARPAPAAGPSPRVTPIPRPQPQTRYLPMSLRRAVYVRDEGRCRYTNAKGWRCPERDRLEYHHRLPYAMGGRGTLRDVCLMCPAHNQYEAEHDFGGVAISRHRSARASRKKGSA